MKVEQLRSFEFMLRFEVCRSCQIWDAAKISSDAPEETRVRSLGFFLRRNIWKVIAHCRRSCFSLMISHSWQFLSYAIMICRSWESVFTNASDYMFGDSQRFGKIGVCMCRNEHQAETCSKHIEKCAQSVD